MNNQNRNYQAFFTSVSAGLVRILAALLILINAPHLSAQIATINYSGDYQDVIIPTDLSAKYLTITAVGGDGGRIKRVKSYNGGRGALVKATFELGSDADQLHPGGTIRFIVGGQGDGYKSMDANIKGVGGGGGTGVAYRGPEAGASWELLMVAGGGGGAFWSGFSNGTDAGDPGRKYDRNDIGNGQAGIRPDYNDSDFGGAGAFGESSGINTTSHPTRRRSHAGWPNGPDAGEPTGGSAWDGGVSGLYSGGWGFGAGGIGPKDLEFAGGGGGYTGGSAGTGDHGGKGGYSYLSTDMNTLFIVTEERGTTSDPQNGYAIYEYTDSSPIVKIRRATAKTKCFELPSGRIDNGSSIGLGTCSDDLSQQWGIEGSSIRQAEYGSKCLDLDHSNTANGTNIQLWDCNGTDAQNWIYDVANQSIRSRIDFNKCLDVNEGNIQLFDCNYTNAQRWIVDQVTSAMPTAANQRIHVAAAPNKCLDVANYNIANSTNIQLSECKDHPAQYFTFDGRTIKLQAHPDKCLDLSLSQTDNGKNIQLFDCNGTDAQNWIYDGFTKAFRSAIDPGKCLDVTESNFTNATNIQLWDCNGTDAQQFEIY